MFIAKPLSDSGQLAVDLVHGDRLRSGLLAAPQPLPPLANRVAESKADVTADEAALIPAAVLLALVARPQPTVLFTERSAHLNDHPGQVSFPGGRVDASDPSPTHTALRETWEEIGIAVTAIDVRGYLPNHATGTGFCVTPVVAVVQPDLELTLDRFEVASVFEVPLDKLLCPLSYRTLSGHWRGRHRHSWCIDHDGHTIWGATASMLHVFASRFIAAMPQLPSATEL